MRDDVDVVAAAHAQAPVGLWGHTRARNELFWGDHSRVAAAYLEGCISPNSSQVCCSFSQKCRGRESRAPFGTTQQVRVRLTIFKD